MEINLHMPKLPRIPYFVLSVALDVLGTAYERSGLLFSERW